MIGTCQSCGRVDQDVILLDAFNTDDDPVVLCNDPFDCIEYVDNGRDA